MRLSRLLLVTVSAGIVAVGALAAQDMRRVTLESDSGRREYRRVEHGGYVRLVRRLSDKPCIQGRSWGYDRSGIWVDDGCRAIFEYSRYDDRNRRDDQWNRDDWDRRDDYNRDRWDRNDRNNDRYNDRRTITLESDGDGYRSTRIDTRGGVRLLRQLSGRPCVQGRSWGYDRDKIWVDNGCRAVFEVGYGNGNGYGYGRQLPDWFPGQYRGYDNGNEFYLTVDRNGRVTLRRMNNGRWGRDEYGTWDDSSIRVGDWDYGYSRSGSSVRLQSRNGSRRGFDLRKIN